MLLGAAQRAAGAEIDLDGQRHLLGSADAEAEAEAVGRFGECHGRLKLADLGLAALGARLVVGFGGDAAGRVEWLIVAGAEALGEHPGVSLFFESFACELPLAEEGGG